MSTSGTLHKFFKQPSQSTDRQPAPSDCIVIEDLLQESNATPSSSSKRKSVVSTGDVGKRRKLSLSTLRVKQNNIAALPPMVVIPEAEQQTSKQADSCTKSPTQSVKDVLSYSKSKVKEVLPKDDLDKVVNGCTKSPPQSVKDVLSYSKSKVKEVLPKDNPDKAGPSNSKSKSDSPIRAKCKSSNHLVLSDSDEEMDNLTSAEPEKSGRSKSPERDASSSTSDDEEADVDSSFGRRSKMMLESDSDEEIKISSAVESEHKRSKSPTLQASTEDDHVSTMDTSVTGRRSGRTRKPVERFTIDLSEDEDDTKRKSCKKKTPSKKKGKENTPPLEDELFIIDDKPKPRRSVSAVLGGKGADKKKKAAEPARMSSSSLMQEAKKLMLVSSSNRSSPIHMSSSSPTPASAASAPKLSDEVVWPKISHCGLSKEIIMYPLLEDDPEYLEDFDLDLDALRTGFRHEIPQPPTNKSQVCSKRYDECVDELTTNHPSSNVENIVQQYTNCKRSPSHLLSEGPKELQQWEDRTWNQIYCPVDYKKIIGNKSEVKQLYKWLDGWRVRLLNEKIRKKKKHNSYSDSDSDSEYVDTDGEEMRWLDNVVLITGPWGVGKSGAIATCANQLGYKVKELNASSERTGKNVAELFSEASQSHCVTGKSGAADFTKLVADISAKNAAKRKKRKSAGGLENFYSKPKKTDKNSSEIINVDKPSKVRKKKKSEEGKERKKKNQEGKGKLKLAKQSESNSVAAVQEAGSKVEKLSLIVLEEIDIAFEEDRGFLAAIVALTQVAKRPIILTSNNPNIALPTDSDFLVLKFNPPKTESVMLNMGCLSLSCNNHIAPYQLQQYSQYFNSDLRRLLVNLEFLNISSSKGNLTEIDIARHFFGVKRSLAPQKLFLEQTQALNLQFVYLNLGKLLKKKQPKGERNNLLEQVVCSDTFVYLDMLSPKTHSSELDVFPVRTSSSLLEDISLLTDCGDDCFMHRVSVEDGLLNFLNVDSNSLLNTRVNSHKLKECKRYAQIKEVQRGIHEAVSHVNLVSRSVMDEFSALRGICKVDKIKEESGAKRRFKHYLDNDIGIKNRELLAEYWLGS
ncbi:replication factor C subunit 1-like isoform X2 [Bolinopsis microptera]|uniref:replication factor C subunit 1-like isoform X2 n=1 Tax=Bolinopsis microptera TaxID=2820187 RepID=UPI00307ADB11